MTELFDSAQITRAPMQGQGLSGLWTVHIHAYIYCTSRVTLCSGGGEGGMRNPAVTSSLPVNECRIGWSDF